jgi:methylated-DNA-protein-cysteine methyltransferase-like protein
VKKSPSPKKKPSTKKQPSPLFARVHALVRAIPRGRVATYGQLSQLIDGRLTPVGIGWAMSGCPTDVPWHRVINSKGGISTGGNTQRAMLKSEGVRFGAGGTVDLTVYQWQRQPPKKRREHKGL